MRPHARPLQRPSQVQIHDPRLERDIFGVNELEWVRGELWGNVYPMYQGTASECIARINATSGEVGEARPRACAAPIQPHIVHHISGGAAYEASHRTP